MDKVTNVETFSIITFSGSYIATYSSLITRRSGSRLDRNNSDMTHNIMKSIAQSEYFH